MANKRYYKALAQAAKKANRRMRDLEKAGIKSPAYNAIQGALEQMGKRGNGDSGRRFSETGKATWNQYQQLMKHLRRFNNAQTATATGSRRLQDRIWATANTDSKLSKAGITKEQYFDIWKNAPDKKDRLYGSTVYVNIVSSYVKKRKDAEERLNELEGKSDSGSALSAEEKREKKRLEKLQNENELSVNEIVEEINAAKSYKVALRSVGLSYKDVKSLGAL